MSHEAQHSHQNESPSQELASSGRSSMAPPVFQLQASSSSGSAFDEAPLQRNLPERAADIEELTLDPGSDYAVTIADMQAGQEPEVWRKIARDHGMLPEQLQLFNQHVESIRILGITISQWTVTPELAEGVSLYIPSADELSFLSYREQYPTYEETVQHFGESYLGTTNEAVMESARSRASGAIGESYATTSTTFLSPNPSLNGASSNRSETIDGQTNYRIVWGGSDYWKCNIYMHDSIYGAGYVPQMNSRDHYVTAGSLHQSDNYTQIAIDQIGPGSIVQFFGDSGRDESHNMILTTFIDRNELGNGTEDWSFRALGASSDRADETTRQFSIDLGNSSGTDYLIHNPSGNWTTLRFFNPNQVQ